MVAYIFTRVFVELFRFVPFFAVYIISDIIQFILFNVFGYRKKVIFKNLHIVFPEKTEDEIQKIAKGFYQNFTDLLLETIKGFSISEKEILRRYKVLNAQVLDKYYNQGKSVISLAGHYANWEWGIILGKVLKHETKVIYKPLSNNKINTYMKLNRERFGINMIPMKETNSAFVETNKPFTVFLVADQSPSSYGKAIWIDFLGQETACIHGPEAYSRKMGSPVVFYKIKRVKRGFYTLEIIELTNKPNKLKNGELTKLYMNLLEN
ncbi:MAG: hypothetical protein B6I20_07115, partial [Bacteroidetes bacterium 4572_117]